MDFNSRRLPLEFISLYLDMASEEQITDVTQPATESSGTPKEMSDVPKELNATTRPDSSQSTSSGNTDESFTLYTAKTLQTMATADPTLEISFLPTPVEIPRPEENADPRGKTSVSVGLEKTNDELQPGPSKERRIPSCLISKQTASLDKNKDYFATDTSEVEELYDSMGAEGVQNRPTSSIVDSDLLSFPGDNPVNSKDAIEETSTK